MTFSESNEPYICTSALSLLNGPSCGISTELPLKAIDSNSGRTMTLKDLLKKREKIGKDAAENQPATSTSPPAQFTFMRSDTHTQEQISPPSFPDDEAPKVTKDNDSSSKRFARFRSLSNASTASNSSSRGEKRLSARFHFGAHSRTSSSSSVNVPTDLPTIGDENGDGEEREAQWENRATLLAQKTPLVKETRSRQGSVAAAEWKEQPPLPHSISDAQDDVWRQSPEFAKPVLMQ